MKNYFLLVFAVYVLSGCASLPSSSTNAQNGTSNYRQPASLKQSSVQMSNPELIARCSKDVNSATVSDSIVNIDIVYADGEFYLAGEASSNRSSDPSWLWYHATVSFLERMNFTKRSGPEKARTVDFETDSLTGSIRVDLTIPAVQAPSLLLKLQDPTKQIGVDDNFNPPITCTWFRNTKGGDYLKQL
jgi:hypothetical protein